MYNLVHMGFGTAIPERFFIDLHVTSSQQKGYSYFNPTVLSHSCPPTLSLTSPTLSLTSSTLSFYFTLMLACMQYVVIATWMLLHELDKG